MKRKKQSAGIILFRFAPNGELEILLVHPGGPFWAKRDDGAWSLAKGEVDDERERGDLLGVARREFLEETGFEPQGEFIELGSLQQPGGKTVHAWGVSGNWDPSKLVSNTFEMEWPTKSGKIQKFPEVDRAEWFDAATAKRKILKGQIGFIDRLLEKVL